ncbi:FUSC family protein [Nocardia sp. CA-119907]|uniref:FUSC family protein n=1 Tax=Nocardia sp. CA-119907 TaxID=3239973 RepID=UPI003D96A747
MPSDTEPLPRVARIRSLLFALPTTDRRWGAGLRAAAAVAIPGAALIATGHADTALFVIFGAFAVLYGEGRAYRVRAWVTLTAGAWLLVSTALGALAGFLLSAGPAATTALVLLVTGIGMTAVFVVDALRLGPPGGMFFALVGGGALAAAESGTSLSAILVAAALGVAASALVSMAGAVIDPHGPERAAVGRAVRAVDVYSSPGHATAEARHAAGEAISWAWSTLHDARLPERRPESTLSTTLLAAHGRFSAVDREDEAIQGAERPTQLPVARPGAWYRLRRSATTRSHAACTMLRVGVAGLVAGSVSAAAGLDRPQWAILSVLVVLQTGPDRRRGLTRGLHRVAGTIAGLALFAVIYELSWTGYRQLAVIVVLQFCIEVFISRNYGIAAAFITPVALLASGTGAGHAAPVETVIRDRLVETAIGVLIALLSMYLVAPQGHRRTFHWTEERVRAAALHLLEVARTEPVDGALFTDRRNLQFELVGAARAGIDSAHNDLVWSRRNWPARAALIHRGYDLLAACWATPPGQLLIATEQWENDFRAEPDPYRDGGRQTPPARR